jgi:hypothetical protein
VIVTIGRLSSSPEVGALSHYPENRAMVRGVSVLRTVCGRVVIGQTFDREDGATCAMCRALSGEHPGGNGKRYLTRWHRSTHPPVPRQAEEAGHGR